MDEIRRKRVEETLRLEVSALLMRGDVKDPRVDTFMSITRVEVARDGSHAKLYLSTFKEGDALALIKWKEIFERLEKAVDRCEDVASTIESILIENA